ncbi:DUF2478 domain-containing protein [Aureimonas leprariae]|uniref:DUF2478 domain-containing protein n=1 Tax=Plantimonas leprariae TaxID=2615207 RepID=UPI003CCCFB61
MAAALPRKPDLAVLNRFGRAEMEGHGLIGLLAAAFDDVVPVAVAVPVGLREGWIESTGGLAVSVEPDPAQLLRWWRSLGNGPREPNQSPDECRHAR